MELRRYAILVWRWLWLIVLCTLLAGISAYAVSKRTTPVYEASSMLLVSQSKAGLVDQSTLYASERLAGTYAELLRRQPVLDEVIQRLQLDTTVEKLGGQVSVSPLRNTQLLLLKVEDPSPQRAAAIANEVPAVFIQQNEAMQAGRFAIARSGLRQRLAELQDQIARTQTAIADLERTANPSQTELDRLQRDLRELQVSYTSLFKSEQDLSLEEARQLDTVLVTEQAQPPLRPVRPRTAQNMLLAAVVGAMLAVGAAFLIEYLDDVLKNPDDVQQTLGLVTLGAVPLMPEAADGNELVVGASHSMAKESYRVLRTNLQFAAVDHSLRTLLVTSPSPSEGKSLTAANLAAAMAQAGRRVILVDADLHRPRLHRIFKLPNSAGLTSALLDHDKGTDGLLQETPVEGLRVLTSGQLPPNPAELLGSSRMRELLEQMTGQADIVVLDSPPATALADSAILATQSDGVLLVLDAGHTRRDMAGRALSALQQVKARVVGAVLNRMPVRGPGSYYYYYYYYHYSHYYGSGDGSGENAEKPKNGWLKKLRPRRVKTPASA